MTSFSTQRQQVLDLAGKVSEHARAHGHREAAGEIADAAAALADQRLTVAVVGEFKRGKSSLLNALLDEPDLFPVDTSIATNLVTTVEHADEESITVVAGEGEPEVRSIERDRIRDFVTEQGNPGNEENAQIVTIALPNPKLADGLRLVDTPGVGGLNKAHTAITYGFVTSADVVLFVLDALTPLSTEELEFLERIRDRTDQILFVITKIDKVDSAEAIVDNTREKVAAVLDRPEDEITIVPVSSFAKLESLKSGDEEDLEVSNFGELESELWGLLRKRGGALMLLRPLGAMARGLDLLIEPIDAELRAYRADSDQDAERAGREYEDARARLDELQAGEASWRRALERRLAEVRIDMSEAYDEAAAGVNDGLDTALHDEAMLESPEQIASMLERELALVATDLDRALRTALDDVTSSVAKNTGVELNPAAPDVDIAAEASRPDIDEVKMPGVRGQTVLQAATSLSTGATAGVTVISIVGGVLGVAFAPVVIAGAALFGGVQLARKTMKEHESKSHEHMRNELRKQLRPHVQDALRKVDSRLKRALTRADQAIADDFDARLAQERRRLTDSIEAVKAARERTAAEAEQRAAELQGPLAELKALRDEVTAHADAAVAVTAPVG